MAIAMPLMWRPPIVFPICIEITDVTIEKLADWIPSITIIKADDTKPANIKICWVDKFKVRIEKTNIKEIDIIVGPCFGHFVRALPRIPGAPTLPPEWTPDKVEEEAINYIKSTCDRLDIEVISDVPEERFCFILPSKWRFKGILKDNTPISYDMPEPNKVCFTVTHTSPTLITIQLISDVTQTVQATTNLIAPLIVLIIMVYLVRALLSTIKLKG
ncbi:MAG: hypothetical protein QXO00_02485 [Candidatus Bathyarchaeia archaeon]